LTASNSSAIGIDAFISKDDGICEFNEHEYRKFIRTLSDDELVRAGKQLRVLCGDVVTTVQCVFDQQLKICREEYRRRHPK
jgi:hypothetical protein